ncbi:LytTR family transcriptional regulator [Streptococcus sp. HF-1907]|uniref:LytTR family DNA-binding domain-containing protein n=1 Tax=Streptococcus sp. HF-1907 TaxID=2785793 RepID=UPI0018A061EA|nr:LytTR family DNA-binding domain-containing protein [Streptococcus sp. HF-1907]MBF7094908.1 LytTR family transcriptional regulator [Streptococcus sp. HF-1907]
MVTIKIEMADRLSEVEILIRTPQLTDEVLAIQQLLAQAGKPTLAFYKDSSEYFIDVNEVLFFETDGSKIYGHTRQDAYEVKLKLYELDEYLPRTFCRISKSAIVNIKSIYSLDKSFSGSSRIRFNDTKKEVYVSRRYYHLLKEKLQELR